ncbi:MAG TPA: hypothetical protein VFY69_06295, partial [Solirubrobacterales bacterium]|nr:hypothetical protein [Solirubrobacterales bacterium]
PEPRYNYFCREVFAFKRDVLGAEELIDCELKGNSCFAKSAFRKREATGHSRLLEGADKMLKAIKRHKGKVFLIWTSDPTLSLLNYPDPEELSKPYKQLLFDMRALMINEAPGKRGALTFDQRHHREDEAAACAISNYLFRAAVAGSSASLRSPTSRPVPSALGFKLLISPYISGLISPTRANGPSWRHIWTNYRRCATSIGAADSSASARAFDESADRRGEGPAS